MSRNDSNARTTRGIGGNDPAPVVPASTKSAFQQMLATDAAVFANPDELAETAVYTPHVGPAVTRDIVVNRAPVSSVQHGGKPAAQNVFEIWIANDATLGVSSVKEHFDKVTVVKQQGGSTTQVMKVNKIIDQDAGMWHLEVSA